MLHILLSILEDKVSWRPKFNRTQSSDNAKTVGHQTCRKKKKILLLWTKHEKLKFTSLTISPETAAVEWFLIMNLLLLQLWSLQSIMHCECALYVAAYFSQYIMAQRSRCTCQHLCLVCWLEAWIWWENNSRLVCCIKTLGHETTSTVISIRPRTWGGLKQSVFGILISLWLETDGNVHHSKRHIKRKI